MTFWDKRTPPLQEKWRFGTSGPLRFKKNDVLGRADPSASLLQSGNFKIYSFFICLLNEKMTSITKIKAIALTRLNNLEYGAVMESLWTFLLQIFCIKKAAERCFARNGSEREFKRPRSLSHNGSRYKHIFWQDRTRIRVPSEWSVASLTLYNEVSLLTRRRKRQRFSW